MAQGKAFGLIEIKGLISGSDRIPAIVSFTGGATNPIMRDVPSGDYGGNTTVKEPTGGVEYEDFEFTIQERLDEGIEITELYEAFEKWKKRELGNNGYRLDLDIVFFKNEKYEDQVSRLSVLQAYCIATSNIEFDRLSNDARSFTATVTHKGSTFTKTGNAPTGANRASGTSLV